MDGSAATLRPDAPAAPPPSARPAAPAGTVTPRQWLGFMAMVFGMFMALLDIQIVSSSITEIGAGLAAGPDEISWVQTSYLIAEVIMIPLSGYLSRLLSTRVLFTLSALGFTAMSFACAFTTGLNGMIVARALQGFLGGAMIPTVFAVSFTLFPMERRAGISVVVGLVATMAPTLGPTLGGYITQSLSWHWLFLINVVPGLIVASVAWAMVDVDRPDPSLKRGFDVMGLALLALFLGSLEYVLEEGPRNDWFGDATISIFAILAVIGAALFFWRVLSYRNPIVDMRAFADRNFAIGCLYSFIIGVGLYGSVYITPIFLARIRGYNSLQIGLMMMVTGAFQILSAPIAGALSKKLDLRVMLALGLGLFGTGVYLNTYVTAEWSFGELFLPQALRGMSLMLCFIPINSLALGTLPPDKLKNASGLYNLMRNLGGAIGLAAINTSLTERLALHQARLAENLTAAKPSARAFLDGLTAKFTGMIPGDPALAALKQLSLLVRREAMVLTFGDTLLMMAGVFGVALLLMPLVRKPRAAPVGAH
ncbi:MAG: DHA2 family efflux MFS transporter permease subunit [Candidatus Eiseniibacteriota bacterium]